MQVLKEVKKLQQDDINLKVIVGPANRHCSAIHRAAGAMVARIEIIRGADDATMADAMAWADLAISSVGTPLWELCLFGVPVMLIVIADNQRVSAEKAFEVGIASEIYNVLDHDLAGMDERLGRFMVNREKRQQCARKMQALVQGNGSAEVIRHLVSRNLFLRPVEESDCYQVWEWNNDQVVRELSFQTQFIPWERHLRWYRNRMADQNSCFFIAEDVFGNSLGLIRFQQMDQEAEIGVVLDPKYRGYGYGSLIIRRGMQTYLREKKQIDTVYAWIRTENRISGRVFRKAGFVDQQCFVREKTDCFRLRFSRDMPEKEV